MHRIWPRLALLLVVGACARSTVLPAPAPAPAPGQRAPSNLPADEWVEQTLRSLTLRQKVGQLLVPRISGAYLAIGSPEYQRLYDWVVTQGIGGVVITQGPPLEMASKLNIMQNLARVPLLVTADMEHGPGQILQSGYILPYGIDNGSATRFPPLMGIGATGDERFAYALGKVTAVEARSVGVHLNFAPVVDVNNNSNNPIINTRSYGEDPALVGRLAKAHVRGLQENGMLSTAKHFPGHGDTGTDSHIQLPVITATSARTDTVELPPYRNAIEAGVSAIMSAHIAFPALTGDSVPATLNPKILTGLLRDRLHFQGLIVTDAMDMGAIVREYGNTHASVLAVKAGADALLQPLPQDVAPIIDAVVEAVKTGELTEARIDQSVRKLLAAKAGLGLHKQRTVDLSAIPAALATPGHLAIADTAAERSITAVRNSDNLLPLTAQRVLSIVYADDYDPWTGRSFQATLAAALPGMRTALIDRGVTTPKLDSLFASIEPGTVVLFSPYIRVTAGKGGLAIPDQVAAFVRRTASAHKVVLTTFGNPYVLMQFPEIGTYVIAWGQWDVLQRAAARALTGQVAITGKLPIAIPPLHKLGEGLQIPARSGASRE